MLRLDYGRVTLKKDRQDTNTPQVINAGQKVQILLNQDKQELTFVIEGERYSYYHDDFANKETQFYWKIYFNCPDEDGEIIAYTTAN